MRVFLLLCTLLGGFLGAGFASGKEIAVYFGSYGESSYFAIIFASIFVFLFMLFFFWLSSCISGFDGLVHKYFPKKQGLIKILFSMCIFILVSTMFAGIGCVGTELGEYGLILFVISVVVVFVCNYVGIRGIGLLNSIIVPFIIIIIISVYGGETFDFEIGYSTMSVISGVNYAAINMLMLGVFILEIGHRYSRREKLLASILFSLCVFMLLLICNNTLLVSGAGAYSMPILLLAKSKNNVLYFMSIVTIYLAIITSIISNIFVLDNYYKDVIGNKFLRLFFIIIFAIILSKMGFDVMVSYMYNFIGILGVFLIVCIIIKEQKFRRSSALKYR